MRATAAVRAKKSLFPHTGKFFREKKWTEDGDGLRPPARE
jgi:hypothetical protein